MRGVFKITCFHVALQMTELHFHFSFGFPKDLVDLRVCLGFFMSGFNGHGPWPVPFFFVCVCVPKLRKLLDCLD